MAQAKANNAPGQSPDKPAACASPPSCAWHALLWILSLCTAGADVPPPDAVSRAAKGGSGGPVLPPPRYVADPGAERVKTLLFTTIAPDYLTDRVDFFARHQVAGVMMGNIMEGWESDVWKQPTKYTPMAAPGRIVGESNPLLVMCRRMNARCREAGIRCNSVKVAFSRPLPDWFDDPAWSATIERFRQGAIFARDADFAGISLDAEYVAEQYKLSFPAYQAAGYPREKLHDQVLKRGRQLMLAMLDEYPKMIFWLLPEIASSEDWLANELFAGLVLACAERDAPGGFHLCKEETYLQTRPRSIMWCVDRTNRAVAHALSTAHDDRVMSYWQHRGSIAVGLWPLGYYREIYDSSGKLIGYTGKYDKFHDQLVGSTADKSENYSADEFKRSCAAARLLSRSYIWIYCHGQVLWQMNPDELRRYHGDESDALATVGNLQDYLGVLRERSILDDPAFLASALQVREQKPLPFIRGAVPKWQIVGPFPHDVRRFEERHEPETRIDLRARYGPFTFNEVKDPVGPIGWQATTPAGDGFIDLKKLLGKPGTPVAYGAAWIETDSPRRIILHVGSNDYSAVFVNGQRLYQNLEARPAVPDDDRVTVQLPEGRSSILVKCADAGGKDWGFYVHVTDDEGNPIESLRWIESQ